ncbi:MAG TPA: gamma carbonic anhydrase family protein [Methylophilus sp.]
MQATFATENFEQYQPHLGAGTWLHASATVIGQVHLGADCSVWPGTVIRGDVNRIVIGDGSNIQDNSVLHVSHPGPQHPQGAPLIIGQHVSIGHRVLLHGCTIEDECLIGMGSILMDHVLVKKHVIVAAGSLVPEGKILESGFLYMGSPVRQVRPLTAAEIAYFRYLAAHYVQLKQRYQAMTSQPV